MELNPIIIQWLIIGVIGIATVITIPKIIQLNRLTSTKSQKKLQALDQEYIEELEYQLKKFKNKANSMENGPKVEGDISELATLLPNVIGEFSNYAPKWLKPILAQPDAQKWIIEYVEKNPEQASKLFSRIVKPKGSAKGEEQTNPLEAL